MIAFNSARTKALVLFSIMAATSMAAKASLVLIGFSYWLNMANTGCQSAGTKSPCNTFLEPNYGITTTVQYTCEYDLSGHYVYAPMRQACFTALNSGCCNFTSAAACPPPQCYPGNP